VATALVVLAILGFSQFVPIQRLAGYTSQIVLTVFVFVKLSLIVIKGRHDPPGDAFEIPTVVPVLGLVTSAGMLAFSFV
jgi:hypothetical protein